MHLALWLRRGRKGTPSGVPLRTAPSAVILSGGAPRRSEGSLYFVLAVLLLTTPAVAQDQTIHVQFLNGTTGQPLKNLSVVINLNWPGVESGPGKLAPRDRAPETLILRSDSTGTVSVKIAIGELVMANPERSFHVSCVTRHTIGAKYDVARILSDGVVEENHCGSAKFPDPKPNVLVVGYRRETFVESLGDN